MGYSFYNVKLEISADRSRAIISATRHSPRKDVFIKYEKDENGNVPEPECYFKGLHDLYRELSFPDRLRFESFRMCEKHKNLNINSKLRCSRQRFRHRPPRLSE